MPDSPDHGGIPQRSPFEPIPPAILARPDRDRPSKGCQIAQRSQARPTDRQISLLSQARPTDRPIASRLTGRKVSRLDILSTNYPDRSPEPSRFPSTEQVQACFIVLARDRCPRSIVFHICVCRLIDFFGNLFFATFTTSIRSRSISFSKVIQLTVSILIHVTPYISMCYLQAHLATPSIRICYFSHTCLNR